MIPEVTLARIARSAGVEDPSVVRLDVLSVYLLQALHEAAMFGHMAFKGGNSLRKIFARRGSRFSRDLDFVDASYQQLSDEGFRADHYYLALLEHLDNRTIHDIHWRIPSIADDDLQGDTLRVDMHFFIHGDQPGDGWENRSDNVLALEFSFRRPILLGTEPRELREESWFSQLEFTPSPIPVLRLEEAIAEKVRASFQRDNPRDVYDLYQYSALVFDDELVRSMAVLKCWQDRGTYDGPTNFDPEAFLAKLDRNPYAWERLDNQVAARDRIDPRELLTKVKNRFGFLAGVIDQERELCLDRRQQRLTTHDAIWEALKRRHADLHG